MDGQVVSVRRRINLFPIDYLKSFRQGNMRRRRRLLGTSQLGFMHRWADQFDLACRNWTPDVDVISLGPLRLKEIGGRR